MMLEHSVNGFIFLEFLDGLSVQLESFYFLKLVAIVSGQILTVLCYIYYQQSTLNLLIINIHCSIYSCRDCKTDFDSHNFVSR